MVDSSSPSKPKWSLLFFCRAERQQLSLLTEARTKQPQPHCLQGQLRSQKAGSPREAPPPPTQ